MTWINPRPERLAMLDYESALDRQGLVFAVSVEPQPESARGPRLLELVAIMNLSRAKV